MTRAATWLELVRSTFWALPVAGIILAVAAGVLLPGIDDAIELPDPIAFSGEPATGRSVLQVVATLAVSVAGVSFSVIVVALVLASQQLSPRVLQNFQRHPLNQAVLGVFLGNAAFSLFVLASVDGDGEKVPELSIGIAMLVSGLSLALFALFLHHVVRSLNASAVIRRIAADGHQSVHAPYPVGVGREPENEDDAERRAEELCRAAEAVEVRAPRAGYVASVQAVEILEAAEELDAFVEQRPAIGEFVVTGGLLARGWCAADRRDELAERVNERFVLKEERMVDDDVALPLRQLADVALKGLSPGINDPTTAENAMDSVTDTLVRLGRQRQGSDLRVSEAGAPRLRTTAPQFDDLVRIGFDQVRRDGAGRPSFAVRLIELLAELRARGGEVAARSPEVARQARLTCEAAVHLADVPADAWMVEEAHRRLHPSDGSGDGSAAGVPAAGSDRS